MKILYAIDHVGGGGAENQFVELVRHMARNPDAEVRCFLAEAEGVRIDRLRSAGVEVALCRKARAGRDTLRAVRQLRQLYEGFRPDVVHAFLMYSTFVAALALRGAKPPCFLATEFSSPEQMIREVRFSALKRVLMKRAYKKLDLFVTTSSGVRDEIVAEGYMPAGRMRVVHEGVDTSVAGRMGEKTEARREAGIPLKSRVISVVGALVERKGHRFLLEAFAQVARTRDSLLLYVVGVGPCMDELKRQAEGLGIGGAVVFTGYREDAKTIIRASDVCCLPSLYEGMPNVVMESMALATPVVATARYGALDLIENGVSGLLVEPGDSAGLADALGRLLDDPAGAGEMARKARRRIEGFDFSVVADKYYGMYREMIS